MNGNKPTNFDGKADGGGGVEGGERSTLLHVNVAQQQILRRSQPEPIKCNYSNTIRPTFVSPRPAIATVQPSSLPAPTASVSTAVTSASTNVPPVISKTGLVQTGSTVTVCPQMASIIRGPMVTQQSFVSHVSHPAIQANYSSHLPRGAAAVACITNLKPAVATPIRAHILASNVVSSTSGSHHLMPPRLQAIRGTLPTVSKSTLSLTTDISQMASSTTSNPTPTQIVLASSRTGDNSLRSAVVHGAAVISKSHSYVQQVSSLEKGFYKPNITSAAILPTQVATAVPATASHVAPLVAIGQQASSISSISVTLPSTTAISSSTTQIHLPLHQQISLAGAQVGSISPSVVSSSVSHTHANLPKVITSIPHYQPNSIALSSRTIKTAPISTSVVSQTGNKPMISSGIATATIPVAKVFPQPVRPEIITHGESNRSATQATLFVSPPHRATSHLSVNPNSTSISTGIVVSSSGVPTVSSNVLLTDNRTERSVVGSAYNFPPGAAYFYEPLSTVSSTLTMHSSSFATLPNNRTGFSANSTTGVKTTSISTVAVNPVMMSVTSTRPQILIETSTSSNTDPIMTIVSSGSPVAAHSSNSVVTSSPIANTSSSPRPSILRKRAIDGSQVSNTVKRNLLTSLSTSLKMSSPQLEVLSATTTNIGVLPKPATSRDRDNFSENGQLSELSNIAANSASALNVVIKQETVDNSETSTASSLLQLGPGPEASPRKKPRKQQLTGNELVETHSTEGEEEFEKESKEIIKKEIIQEDTNRSNWISRKNRSPVTLLNSYRHTWKSRHNHFLRYTDVKPREERRPTIFELVGQKYVTQKVNGWKIHHLCAQMEDVVDLEGSVHSRLISLLDEMEKKEKFKDVEDIDLDRTIELMRGNIQRCKLIKDQMKDAKQQVLKVLDHKTRVSEIVSKYVPKQSSRRREKMFLF